MKAHRMLSITCAIVACVAIGCSTDTSAPTGTDEMAFGRPAPEPQPVPDPAPVPDDGQPSQRTIEEFLAAQGTYCASDGNGGCMLYAAPVPNYLTWFDREQQLAIAIDYAGVVKTWMETHGGQPFGTNVSGSVFEQPLPDGRARVTVDLHAINATSFMVRGPDLRGQVVFGIYPNGPIVEPNRPALGDAHIQLVFINPRPGAPLPDLVQLILTPKPRQEIVNLQLNYDGRWIQPDGMTGHVIVSHHGPFDPAFPGPGPFGPMAIAPITWTME